MEVAQASQAQDVIAAAMDVNAVVKIKAVVVAVEIKADEEVVNIPIIISNM
ncbi:hypothetical protein D3C78_1581340 [compost metagenome]